MKITVAAFRETLGDIDPERVHFMICQQQDDEIEAGIAHLHQLYSVMRNDKREPGKLSELKFGLECGGSDGLSGITANPMLGRFSDYVIANGGTTVPTEVPEMFGAEQLLMDHCRDEATFENWSPWSMTSSSTLLPMTSRFTKTHHRGTKQAVSPRWKINRLAVPRKRVPVSWLTCCVTASV